MKQRNGKDRLVGFMELGPGHDSMSAIPEGVQVLEENDIDC